MSIGIYYIHNTFNNKYYIGQSANLEQRKIRHKTDLKKQKHHNIHLQSAWNKYGSSAFEFCIIENCTLEELNEREMYWISQYNSFSEGYNLASEAKGCRGYKHTEEELRIMRKNTNPRAVLQISSDFEIIARWESSNQAGKTLGFPSSGVIRDCCNRRNHQKTYCGFYWVFEDEYQNNLIDWDYYLSIKNPPKKVYQFDLNMNLIKIWDTSYQAAKTLNLQNSSISLVCNNKRKTCGNYIWRFAEGYNLEQLEKDKQINYSYNKNKKERKIVQKLITGEEVQRFNSICEASRLTRFNRSGIQACCLKHQKSSQGYIWEFI